MKNEKKIAFLDRDGVINMDFGYVHKLDDLVFLAGLEYGLKKLSSDGFKLFIVTNQSGIARGYYTETHFHEFMKVMLEKLKMKGIEISGYEYCPHHRDGAVPKYTKICGCRKPKPGMLERILLREGVEAKDCIIIGDNITDIIAGKSAGIKNRILINKEKKESDDKLCYHVENWNKLYTYLETLEL